MAMVKPITNVSGASDLELNYLTDKFGFSRTLLNYFNKNLHGGVDQEEGVW
jgi:hypothetical protein